MKDANSKTPASTRVTVLNTPTIRPSKAVAVFWLGRVMSILLCSGFGFRALS
jgi:hypothetical protein